MAWMSRFGSDENKLKACPQAETLRVNSGIRLFLWSASVSKLMFNTHLNLAEKAFPKDW